MRVVITVSLLVKLTFPTSCQYMLQPLSGCIRDFHNYFMDSTNYNVDTARLLNDKRRDRNMP